MFNPGKIVFVGFDYANSSELETIKRNLSALYETPAGTCPGDRNYGIDHSFIDYPIGTAKTLYALEVIEKTHDYEPRAKVKEINFEDGAEGNLTPIINLFPSS